MSDKERKSVAIFSNTFWSIYNFRQSMVKALMEAGYQVYAMAANDEYKESVARLGCKTIVIKNLDAKSVGLFKEAWLIREIIATVRRLPCEFIYTFTIKPNLYTALTSSLTGIKCIITVNGLGNVFSEGGTVSTISLRLFKMAFRRAKRIVFQNKDDYSFFEQRIGLGRQKVLFVRGSGVDTERFGAAYKPLTAGNHLVFLLACRLLKEKGVYEYIAAAKKMKALYPNLSFWLLGMEANNPSAISLAELQPYHSEGTITLLPKTDNINELLAKTDVLVLPSFYNEGVPRILLEGLSKGLPIITTNSVGCKETVVHESNGYMIEPRSTEALEEAISRMIALPPVERAAMQVQSRLLAENEFDERGVIKTYINIIERPLSPEMYKVNAVGAR